MSNIPFMIGMSVIIFFAVLGVFQAGVWFHEYLHLQDNISFKREAICFDYTGQSFAYAVPNMDTLRSVDGQSYNDKEMETHFSIYRMEGMFVGAIIAILMLLMPMMMLRGMRD